MHSCSDKKCILHNFLYAQYSLETGLGDRFSMIYATIKSFSAV